MHVLYNKLKYNNKVIGWINYILMLKIILKMNNLYLMNKIKKYLDYVLIIDKNLNILEKYIGILLL